MNLGNLMTGRKLVAIGAGVIAGSAVAGVADGAVFPESPNTDLIAGFPNWALGGTAVGIAGIAATLCHSGVGPGVILPGLVGIAAGLTYAGAATGVAHLHHQH